MTIKQFRHLLYKLPESDTASVMIKLDLLQENQRELYAHIAAVSIAYDDPEAFELKDFDALVLECNVYPGDFVGREKVEKLKEYDKS